MTAPTDTRAAVAAFYDAFNEQDLDAFTALLHPEVELQTQRGPREGREEARAWATKSARGSLDQRLVLEDLVCDDRGVHALATYRKQWWWREEGNLAREDEMTALFTFRDGLIARWQPYLDPAEGRAIFKQLDGG